MIATVPKDSDPAFIHIIFLDVSLLYTYFHLFVTFFHFVTQLFIDKYHFILQFSMYSNKMCMTMTQLFQSKPRK